MKVLLNKPIRLGQIFKYNFNAFRILFLSFFVRKCSRSSNICFYDASLFSDNCGDEIIMNSIRKEFDPIIPKPYLSIPTHCHGETKKILKNSTNIVCGTNIISKNMKRPLLWKLVPNLNYLSNICLCGVTTNGGGDFTFYTKLLLRNILNNGFIHSVRTKEAEKQLKSIGIKNVIYTSCPTLWGMDEENCKKVNVKKGRCVVTTLTFYLPNAVMDTKMINILINNYETVYFWPQSYEDITYLEQLGFVANSKVKMIDMSLKAYDDLLDCIEDLDYVGTRLHGGVHALSKRKRTFIISVDERSVEIANDTFLKVYKRGMFDCLEEDINSDYQCNLKIPFDNIKKYKSQFTTLK